MKTIIAIIPLTFLLACGGGGYSGSIPEPTPLSAESTNVNTSPDVPKEVSQDEPDSAEVVEEPAPSPTGQPTEYLTFGDWDSSDILVYGQKPTGKANDGNLHTRNRTPDAPIDSTFDGAEYNGHSVVKRIDEKYITGDVTAGLTHNNGTFTIEFEFSNMEGVPDLNHIVSDYNPNDGNEFKTSNFKHPVIHGVDKIQGLRGRFSGKDNEYVVGSFGGEGIEIGVFGATRD